MSGISTPAAVTLDAILKKGNSSVEHATIDGSVTDNSIVTESRTIISGDNHRHGNMVLGNGITWTIDAGGWLFVLESISITGTGVLIVNGVSRVI
jgi:hypothetical protein